MRAPIVWSVIGCLTIAAIQPRRLAIGKPTELLSSIEFEAIPEVAIGPNGLAFVLDLTNNQVIALDSAGKVTWRVGRKGDGPGEYRLPVRIAARPQGGAAVLDWSNGRVTLLSSAGTTERTMQLPMTFTQIDGMLILPDGRMLLAAMANSVDTATSRHSIHVFTDSLQYLRSFGATATALDTAAVRYTGSGGISLARDGQILLTRKRPFEIQKYSLDGRLVARIPVAGTLRFELGDLIAIERRGRQTFKGTTAKSKDVEIPVPFVELPDGFFLGGRETFDRTTIDLVTSRGTIESTVAGPARCVQILGVDVNRELLYCKALRDDAPVLYRIPWTIQ